MSLKKMIRPILLGVVFLFCLAFYSLNFASADSTGLDTNSGSSNETTWGGKADDLQGRMGLGNDDPRNIIANIINIALGFLGIVALVTIMYAGFLWMNSGGNPDQINKAKKILINGVIGLIIVLSAFAIAAFILDAIFRATTGNGDGSSGETLPFSDGDGGDSGDIDGGGGMELPCSSTVDSCTPDDSICNELGPHWFCGSKCTCVVENLGSCYNEADDVCNYPCSAGLFCLGKTLASGGACVNNDVEKGCGQGDDTCRCCCDPEDDQCGMLYPTLKCKEDSGDCSGNDRGLCCGCDKDDQCGSVAIVGCGSDTCCNNRPEVDSVIPSNDSGDVCTNALVSVEFTQAMKSSGLADNFLVLGDFGTDPCTAGTKLQNVTELNIPELVQGKNYCAVDGGFSTRNNGDGHYVDFSTNSFFRINTDYYVVIKGDQAITNEIDEGILNYWGISMNGSWSSKFTTINDTSGAGGVCVIESIELTPPAHLFNIAVNSPRENDTDASSPTFDSVYDKDKLFEAVAISKSDQVIVPVTGYDWDWNIKSTVTSVVGLYPTITNLPDSSKLAYVVDGVTDGYSQIIAEANMDDYAATNVSMIGNHLSDSSDVYVFICNNPWPPINTSMTPSWEPWKPNPNDYNYKIYYCRDKGSAATVDDLPAFDKSGMNNPAGENAQIKQQVYFTYKEPPAPGSILVATSAPASADFPDGGVVYLEWIAAPSSFAPVTGYKVYWGTSAGNYSDSADAGNVTGINVPGLNNGTKYYFSITAYTADKAESSLYPEKTATPLDQFAPTVAPVFLESEIIVSATEIILNWSEVATADSYEFAYGLEENLYGVVENVGQDTGITISNLSPLKKYYFGVKVLDIAGNSGSYTTYATTTLSN